jgi:hypothetical protein
MDSWDRKVVVVSARADNLDSPLPGDHGAHGAFEDQAKPVSVQFWASTHRGAVLAAAATISSVLFVALHRLR